MPSKGVLSKIGKHGFNASAKVPYVNDPNAAGSCSISIFTWVLAADGRHCKRGKTKVRISGLASRGLALREIATRIVMQLDAGTFKGPANVRVGY